MKKRKKRESAFPKDVVDGFKAFVKTKYTPPLRPDDLCVCKKERREHEGPDGWGPCLGQGCLQFEDSGV